MRLARRRNSPPRRSARTSSPPTAMPACSRTNECAPSAPTTRFAASSRPSRNCTRAARGPMSSDSHCAGAKISTSPAQRAPQRRLQRAVLDDPGQLAAARAIGVELERGRRAVAAHPHRAHRRDARRVQRLPGAQAGEERGIARGDGVDARVDRLVRQRRSRGAAVAPPAPRAGRARRAPARGPRAPRRRSPDRSHGAL